MVLLLLLFSFALGVQYIFLTPPWQAPDEITHYEYIDILSRAKLFQIKQDSDYKLQKKIIRSMDQFNAWKYVFKDRPSPLPKRFWSLPVYSGSNTKTKRPPLYYISGSIVLKIFNTDNLLLKHYLMRLFSLFLSLFTILFAYLAARTVFDNNCYYSFTAACFVAFLPQFLIMSGTINSDSLANMIGAASIYTFLFSLKHSKNYYILLLFPFLIILGLLTGRTTFFIVPSLAIFSIIYLLKTRKKSKYTALLFVLTGFIAITAAYFIFKHIFPDLGARIATNILEILRNFGRLFQKSFYASFTHYKTTLLRSFWYYSGWMVFRFPDYIYGILTVFSLFGVIGLIKYIAAELLKRKDRHPVKLDCFLLLFSISFLAFIGLMFRLVSSASPMSRYIFPALPALAILFVVGLKELIPCKLEKMVLTVLIFLLVILNTYAIFGHLTNAFYFRLW